MERIIFYLFLYFYNLKNFNFKNCIKLIILKIKINNYEYLPLCNLYLVIVTS